MKATNYRTISIVFIYHSIYYAN